MTPTPDTATERRLGAQRLAQYVTRGRCERYLRFALFPSEARELTARYRVALEPLSPLLSAAGRRFERERVAELRASERVVDMTNRPASDFVAEVAAQTPGRTFYDQPQLEGALGPWAAEGRADLVRVDRDASGRCDLTVIDIKASRRETVGYRLQVAFYARLAREAFARAGIEVGAVRGAIASLETDLAGGEVIDLGIYEDEIERLVAAEGSDVDRVVSRGLERAAYHLGPACDGCAYNAVCFVETAEREDLSLVPLLAGGEKSALRAAGVRTARELAGLMEYGERERTPAAMRPAAGREGDCERIGARWPLASRLPVLAQRARAALRRLDRSVDARPFLLGAGYGSLPDDEAYPDMVKVFADAQRDYLEDRVYMLSALVAGPGGEEEVVEMAAAPPDAAAERDLLVRWTQRVLPAVARAAGQQYAPLHVYLFDRRGQRSLLDALARHFDALCAIPAFYDLLTSSPAVSQGMLSFLAEEVRERQNLGAVCQNLYQVAAEMGFRWDEGGLDARSTFRARIFDNRRPFERDPETGRFHPARKREPRMNADERRSEEISVDAPSSAAVLWVEASARFGVEVPLEYAYSIWGLLEGFAEATADDLRALAARRCRALRHVEAKFAFKNRRVRKTAIDLSRLDLVAVEPREIPFSRTLEDFLLLEHHAARQEHALHLSLPPDLRAQTGRSAVGLCTSCERSAAGSDVATLELCDAGGRPAPLADVGTLRLREGHWVVLNPVAEEGEPPPAWRLVHGRLCVVEAVDASRMRLRLMPLSFKDSRFRYGHRLFTPDPGEVYTVDEMVDDLNADKFLEACRNADTNPLYRWIQEPEEGKRPRDVRPKRLRDAEAVADLAAASQRPHGLTEAQRRVIGGHLADRVLVVQGPPGTGKSHTLGFAVLSRAAALATPARPFRAAVLARTHAATLVALESVARRARQLEEFFTAEDAEGRSKTEDIPDSSVLLRPSASSAVNMSLLRGLRIAKVSADPAEPLPEGVERVVADETAEAQWRRLLNHPFVVVGGTPGGLYNLVKRGGSRGGAIDWREAYFDLVVVDEASQMGIAEALCAAAFLRDDGQFMAIGDHRQMPPILAHAWDREHRRDLTHARPHLAIFDYLRELGFASAALDESFRIPEEIAGFLHRHVYSEDGIEFRSKNRSRVAAVGGLDGWLGAAFEPGHPFVVVEHDESGSQQANEFEASLAEEIVRVATERLGLDAATGVGIVVPHGAQRALLRARLPGIAEAVDTVERFQGGERDLVVVSATVSDREFAQRESSFLLEPRRLTVAVSRPKRKLIVLASRTIFDLIPSDLDEYERGALWKHMRRECSETLWEGEVRGHAVRVRALKQPQMNADERRSELHV